MCYVVGIDPDSDKIAFAIYKRGVLKRLGQLALLDFYREFQQKKYNGTLFVVEDVCSGKYLYTRHQNAVRAIKHLPKSRQDKILQKMAVDVGRCQQSQIELCRVLYEIGHDVKLIPPKKGNWNTNAAFFKQITGWTSRSNNDTRSAAYFGWLYRNSVDKQKSNAML